MAFASVIHVYPRKLKLFNLSSMQLYTQAKLIKSSIHEFHVKHFHGLNNCQFIHVCMDTQKMVKVMRVDEFFFDFLMTLVLYYSLLNFAHTLLIYV